MSTHREDEEEGSPTPKSLEKVRIKKKKEFREHKYKKLPLTVIELIITILMYDNFVLKFFITYFSLHYKYKTWFYFSLTLFIY